MPGTFGELVHEARVARGMSLRELGEALGGLSAPYIHDVEHGRRRLVPSRWAALISALPGLSVRALAEAAVAAGPVELDPAMLTAEQRAHLVEALERQVAA
jgi:transcriptional regulator with XRE-family HTH domain